MNPTVYGIPNCEQMKKTLAWFAAKRIPVTFHDYKKAGATPELLRAWLARTDWSVLVNRAGLTWKKLTDAERAKITTPEAAIAALVKQPSMIKRPVVSVGRKLQVGYDPAAFEKLVGK